MSENNDVLARLDEIQQQGLAALAQVEDEAALQAWRTAHLGRSAPVMLVFSGLGQVSKELRPAVGQKANQVKLALEAAQNEKSEAVKAAALARSIAGERLDVTLPGRKPRHGGLHVQTQTLREIYRVFGDMGFQVYRSRDVELDEFNFELLNFPRYHPAREMQDTFHTTTPDVLLRTHTSPGQIHVMRQYAPEPIRAILPGMVYRYEQLDARHETQFTQVEVLVVGKNITFGDLKGTLSDFARRMFGAHARTSFRPSYFPFTEPSAELSVECFLCGGKGCNVCSNSGWIEILGCGMVHPIVLQNGGYDPKTYTGFAAGMGPERISMLRYHISEIRNFWANDLRFLEQF
jgi:phenylalanyl-tRNA synthetase alpha chain